MPFCPHCGKEVSEGIKFCPECGERLKKEFTPEEKEKYIQELEASAKEEKPAERPKRTKSQLAGIIVGSIVAITIIIAAVVICTPPKLPALTASEQNYAATMADHTARVVEALDNITDLVRNPQIFDDDWIWDLAIELTVIELLYDEALEMEPPSSMAAIHYKYTQAMSHLDNYVDLVTEGIGALDADLLEQATSELEVATEYIVETTELMEDFLAAHSY